MQRAPNMMRKSGSLTSCGCNIPVANVTELNDGWDPIYVDADHIVHVKTRLAAEGILLPPGTLRELPISADGIAVFRHRESREIYIWCGNTARDRVPPYRGLSARLKSELHESVRDFFTSPVDLPEMPDDATVGSVWWETRGCREYPWRVVGPKQGYPCGEPRPTPREK